LVYFTKNKFLGTAAYEKYSKDGAQVLQIAATNLYDYLKQNSKQKLYFYGTKALQSVDGKWAEFASDLFTIDIDLGSEDPSETVGVALLFLFDLAETTVFEIDDVVLRISHVYASYKEDGGFYTIHMDIKIDMPGRSFCYLVCRSGIADITPKKVLSEHHEWQTPCNYLCGLIDKLFNTYLNPRITDQQRPFSAEKTKKKMFALRLPDLTEGERDEILVLSKQSEFTALCKIQYAQDFLSDFLQGNLKHAIDVYFEAFVKSVDLKKK
jgi:hypothetical protein